MPDRRAELKINNDETASDGTREYTTIPAYQLSDVGTNHLRVQTPNGPGAIALADPEFAAHPELRVQTKQGVKAVNKSTGTYPLIYDDFTYGKDHYAGDLDNFVIRESSGGYSYMELVNVGPDAPTAGIRSVTEHNAAPEPGSIWTYNIQFNDPGGTIGFLFGVTGNRPGREYTVTADEGNNAFNLRSRRQLESGALRVDILSDNTFNWSTNQIYTIAVKWFYDYRFSLEIYEGEIADGTPVLDKLRINYWPDYTYPGAGFGWFGKGDVIFKKLIQVDENLR